MKEAREIKSNETTTQVACAVLYTALAAAVFWVNDSNPESLSGNCTLSDTEAFQVIVNRCLEKKGFKVLTWRD